MIERDVGPLRLILFPDEKTGGWGLTILDIESGLEYGTFLFEHEEDAAGWFNVIEGEDDLARLMRLSRPFHEQAFDPGAGNGHELGAKQVRKKKRVPLERALKVATQFGRKLEPLAKTLVLVGSIRRLRPEVADVEFVILPVQSEIFDTAMREMGFGTGPKKRKYTGVVDGLPVEVYVARARKELGSMIQMYTGDYVFNIALRSRAQKMGYKYNQYGIFTRGDKPVFQSPDERDFFRFLDMDWHEPEERSVAARQDLMAMIRDLKKVGETRLGTKMREFVVLAARNIAKNRYLDPRDELVIRRLHEAHTGKASRGGVE